MKRIVEITNPKQIRIFAIDLKDQNQEEEITDLYWFEEQGVHNWSGEAGWGSMQYKYRIEIDVE